MLSGREIKRRINKDIIIEPFDESQVNPNSYNIKLADELYVYDEDIIDIKEKPKTRKITIPKEGLVLEPFKVYIGQSVEYTETYNLVPMIDGRSSLGRLGLFTNASAGFGDVGFKGKWSIQLFCIHPVRIYPHVKIAQLYYEEIVGDFDNYKGKYMDIKENCSSKMYEEFSDKN